MLRYVLIDPMANGSISTINFTFTQRKERHDVSVIPGVGTTWRGQIERGLGHCSTSGEASQHRKIFHQILSGKHRERCSRRLWNNCIKKFSNYITKNSTKSTRIASYHLIRKSIGN